MAYTKEQYKEKVIAIFGNEYNIIGDFKGVTKRVKVRHNKCGKTYEPIARDLMTGRGCSHCYGRKRLSQEEALEETIRRDAIKKKYCSDNNIKLLEIKYTEIKNIGNILDKELIRVNI